MIKIEYYIGTNLRFFFNRKPINIHFSILHLDLCNIHQIYLAITPHTGKSLNFY